MKLLRFLAILAVATMVSAGSAHALILSGTFNVNVYQGSGNGNIGDPNNWANASNPLLGSSPLYSGFYNGAINFNAGANNILNFLLSGGGSLSGSTSALNTTLSTAPFGITTVFDIRWASASRLAGSITHDDGMSLYLNGGTVASSPIPTSPISTPFGLTATSGDYRLVYVAANGLPEVLSINITQDVPVVPEPSSFALLGLGLVAAIVWSRSRRS